MADDITLASGGLAAAREKLINAVLTKVQRTTQGNAPNGEAKTVTVVAAAATVVTVAGNLDRSYIQITNRGTVDIYLALANTVDTDSVANVNNAAKRRLIKVGESWDSKTYLGDITLRANTTDNAAVEIERHW